MPLYDYICPKCGAKEINIILTIQEVKDDKKVKCPKCDTDMERQFPGNITFKLNGTGWTPKFGK